VERVFDLFEIGTVFHAAAMKHLPMCEQSPIDSVQANILGTQNLIDAAQTHHVSRFLTVSTDKAVHPTSVMGACKLISERLTLRASSLGKTETVFSCMRFGNVLNTKGSVIPVWLKALRNGEQILVSHPDVTRFIMTEDEAADGIRRASEYARGGDIFVFKMKAFRLGDLLDVLTEIAPAKLGIETSRIKTKIIGLSQGEKMHEELISTEELGSLYELNSFYIVAPGIGDQLSRLTYPLPLKKPENVPRTSADARLLTRDELRRLIADSLASVC
jgi:FlaA1/EpsC-like NDP-sugar epimerase